MTPILYKRNNGFRIRVQNDGFIQAFVMLDSDPASRKKGTHPFKTFYALLLLLILLICRPVSAVEIHPGDIVFSANVSGRWNLWVLTPDALDPVRLSDSVEVKRHPAVSPKGRELAFIDEERRIGIMEPASGVTRIAPLPEGTYAQPAWSFDGNALAYVQYRALPEDSGEIWWIKKRNDGWGAPERVSLHPPMRTFPSWSPDGKMIACATFNRDRLLGVVEEIDVIALDTGKITSLTRDGADSYWPIWSSDGKRIAYTSNLEGNYDLWVISIPGGEKTRLTNSPEYDGEPSWSPDGNDIVFVSNRTGHRELWKVSVTEKNERQLTDMKQTCATPQWVR